MTWPAVGEAATPLIERAETSSGVCVTVAVVVIIVLDPPTSFTVTVTV